MAQPPTGLCGEKFRLGDTGEGLRDTPQSYTSGASAITFIPG